MMGGLFEHENKLTADLNSKYSSTHGKKKQESIFNFLPTNAMTLKTQYSAMPPHKTSPKRGKEQEILSLKHELGYFNTMF